MTDSEIKNKLVELWRLDPVARHYAFSNKKLWGRQIDVLHAYREHKRTVVKSGNTVGKSFLTADICMDWLTTQYPSRVVTTAPTFSQVEGILWKEIRNYYRLSKIPIGGELLQTELKFNDAHFAEGISTNDVGRFQGRHSEHLLVLLDEASGISKEIWDTTEALHPEKIVAIGNPLEASGNFYDCFSSSLWHHMTISCEDAVKWQAEHGRIQGLVTAEWIDEQLQIHGRSSPWFQIHVMGEFPEQGEDSLISREWVDAARKKDSEDNEDDDIRIVSCDVATKHGDNETVIGYRYGDTIADIKGFLHLTSTETVDRLSLKYSAKRASSVVVDSDGVGEGLEAFLTQRHVPCMEFHGGSSYKSMDDRKFKNLRTQFYYVLAKKFEKGMISLKLLGDKEYDILKNQLCSIKTKYPDGMGRMQIETKEQMLTRGIKSPDYADCLMMSEFGLWMSKAGDIREYAYR